MIEQLKALGLTEYEARVYEALLKLGTATGGQIAKKSNVPHGKTYESLHTLSQKGLLTIVPTEPKIFKIIAPKTAIQNIIKQRTEKLEDIKDSILSEIKTPPSKEEAIQKIEIYSGVKMQFEIGNSMLQNAKREILIVSRGEKVPNSILIQSRKLKKTGVDLKLIVYDLSQKEWLQKFREAGMNVRHYNTGEFTLMVKDNKECMQVIRNPNNAEDRIVIYFKDDAISSAMKTYFYTIWNKAKEI